MINLSRSAQIRWDQVFTTARQHGVAPLVYTNLARCGFEQLAVPVDVQRRLAAEFAQNMVRTRRLYRGMWDRLDFFARHGIEVMLIKGGSLELIAGPGEQYTVAQDLDVILKTRVEDIAESVHAAMVKLTGDFPLEFDFIGHHDLDLNGTVPLDYGLIWRDAVAKHVDGRDFVIMCREDALIAACTNACRKRYFHLKAISELEHNLGDPHHLDWERLFSKVAVYRCGGIVFAALTVCRFLLGTELPLGTRTRLGVHAAQAELIEALVKSFSFTSFANLYGGWKISGKQVGPALLLPYASFTPMQVWSRLVMALSTR